MTVATYSVFFYSLCCDQCMDILEGDGTGESGCQLRVQGNLCLPIPIFLPALYIGLVVQSLLGLIYISNQTTSEHIHPSNHPTNQPTNQPSNRPTDKINQPRTKGTFRDISNDFLTHGRNSLNYNDYHQIAIFGHGAIDIGYPEKWKNSAKLSCINYSKLF